MTVSGDGPPQTRRLAALDALSAITEEGGPSRAAAMRWGRVAATLALTVAVAGCASARPVDPAAGPPATPVTLTVLAAASLTEGFADIGRRFESANPGVAVRFWFDGSATLASQLGQGAPGDLVAVADQATMAELVDAGQVDAPETFASNALVLAVPADNPAGVNTLADLARPGVRSVLCARDVPCGAAAARLLAAAGVSPRPRSFEQNVKAVVTKLTSGEADAGLVFATDVRAAGPGVVALALPDDPAAAEAARTDYSAAVVAGSPQGDWAARFVGFVRSDDGQAALAAAGFGPARAGVG